MSQEDIYRVLLETKQDTGKILATLEEQEKKLTEYSVKHNKLEEKHNALQSSHDSYKGKVLFVSSSVGTAIGGFFTFLYHKYFK